MSFHKPVEIPDNRQDSISGSITMSEFNEPLCVDLDGTLINTDMLLETFLIMARNSLLSIVLCLPWILRGRAFLKSSIASRVNFDPSILPYNDELLSYLKYQQTRGRTLLLVTASDQTVAQRIVEHLGIFDGFIASQGTENLKGPNKVRALLNRFGPKGYSYVGDARSDLPVWLSAKSAILVNVDNKLSEQVAAVTQIEARFSTKVPLWRVLPQALRIHQWVKNLLVLVPLLVAHSANNVQAVSHSMIMFLAFSLAASGTYMLNDLMDLEVDRQHPEKKRRPFACGKLPLQFGLLAPVLIMTALLLGLMISLPSVLVLLIYVVTTSSYSFWLKTLPLVDIFVLSFLYSLRLFAGSIAIDVELSVWLISFSSFIFLALALIKRVGELKLLAQSSPSLARRGYTHEDLPILQTMGVASSFVSALVLALYVNSDVAQQLYPNPKLLWSVVPLILFWQCRLWLSTARGFMHDDPIVYAARDWFSWLIFGSISIIFLAASIEVQFL